MGKLLISISNFAVSAITIFSDFINRSRSAGLLNRVKCGALAGCSRLQELVKNFKPDDFISHIKNRVFCEQNLDRIPESSKQLDMDILNCRIKLTEPKEDKSDLDAFIVEVCGSIHASGRMHQTTLRISILDVTDGMPKAKPVRARVEEWSELNGLEPSIFCYKAELGKLPHRVTTLSDWTAIAQLHLDWLILPRKGRRNLLFTTSILSAKSGQELACARCTVTYDNPAFGYMDLQENVERTKILAVALAFTVSAADDKLYDCEVELIKNWARDNILEDSQRTREKARCKLDKALGKTIDFFHEGNKLDVYTICKEIVEIAPVALRYDILELCLYVAQANGSVNGQELAILNKLANWLEVDTGRFQTMMEKVLPIDMHEVKDVEVILGITSDMSKEKTRKYLNKQYSKWSSRVINSNPEIQNQADQMLKLIAETRSKYIDRQPVLQRDGKVLTC